MVNSDKLAHIIAKTKMAFPLSIILHMNVYKLNSRILWRDSFVLAMGVITVIETLCAISGLGLTDFVALDSWWKKGLIILCTFILIWIIVTIIKAYRANKSIKVIIRGIEVTIKEGDLFAAKGWKLIPFNEFYDTRVDDVVIAHNSLNGQFIENHLSNKKDLQKIVTKERRLQVQGADNERYAFPLGHIIPFEDYLLLAFSHFEQKQAKLNHSEYETCLRNMWKEISRVYANRPVTVPLLGGGITRFEDVSEKSDTHLLRCLLCTLKTSTANIYQPITIVLTKDSMKRINLYELRKMI